MSALDEDLGIPMARLTWPDGSIYTIVRSSAETRGDLLEMELSVPPRGFGPKAHVHPWLTEDFEVLEGRFDVLEGRKWRTLTAGDAVTVTPQTVHAFRGGSARSVVRNVHRPALDFEPYVRALCRIANEHRLGDLSGPRALLHIAVVLDRYPNHSALPNAPANRLLPLAAMIARRIGFGPSESA